MKQVQEKFFTWLDRILRTDTKYIVEGSLWTILGRVSLALFSAITMIAFAKFASQETFGNYQYVITVVGLLSILSLPGMDTALVRSVAMGFDASVHQAHKAKMKWGMLMSMGLFIVAGWYFLHGNNLLGYAFLVAGVFAPLKETYEAYLSFWNGKKQFRTRLVYDVVVTGITAASTLITLMLHAPFLVIMIVFFATRYGAHAIASYFIKKHLENNNQDPHLVEYGKQLTTTNSLTQIIFSIDKLFVWFFLGPVPMAIYVFAMNPIKMIQGFIPIGQISVPKLSHKENVSKKELLRKMFMMFWVIVPLCLVLFAVAPMIYRIFFTKYDLAVPYFRAMILIVLFIPFSLLQAYLIAKKHAQELLRIRTITLTVRFVGFAILVPTLGLTGAVIAAIGVNTLSSILVLYYFLRVPSVIHEGQYVE